jgi:large subunit ribosomal protein L35
MGRPQTKVRLFAMPKMKTKRGAAKRFKRTKSGLFKRGKANSSHFFSSKTTKRKRRLRKTAYVSPSDQSRVERLLPNS